jgi:uncharacterized metal-binding protein YceD (DUF177 family)
LKLVNQYIIPFSGLKNGEHKFSFNFEQKFFDEHEVQGTRGGNLKAIVWLDKKTNLLDLEIGIDGIIEIQCDKCLEYFDFPIRYRGELVVKFGEDPASGTDEIWILRPEDHKLELEQYFFECISLSLPIQRVHPDRSPGVSACNPEMLKLLESYSSKDSDKKEPDPRWNKLKNLLNDSN